MRNEPHLKIMRRVSSSLRQTTRTTKYTPKSFLRQRVPSIHRGFGTSHTAMETKDWSASQYLKFEAERTRPARDLLAQVPLTSPRRVVDLGCGPGNSTELLVKHFPTANIMGLDSSPDMVEKARARLPNLEFTLGDLASFEQKEPADLLYSNALYQWVPYEERIQIFTRLIESQRSGGVFAFQVPDNSNEPSHQAMREVADQGPWSGTLHRVTTLRKAFQSPEELYDNLRPLCSEINIWHTHYHHILEDHKAIVEWVKGTGLRPYIDPLSPLERKAFMDEYLKRVEQAYPRLVDGKVCLRYPRLFLVAVRV